MNISTTMRRAAQGLLVLCLGLAGSLRLAAQCSDFVSIPAGPVTINLTLSAGGTVNLTNAVLNGNGFTKNAACDYWLSQDPDPTNLAAYNNTPITFTCADVATSPQTWYVRVGGLPLITDDMGPGATVVQITVNVIDNIPPTVTCPANVVQSTDLGFCNAVVIGIGASSSDNCSSAHTWSQISGPAVNPFASTPGDASGALFAVGTSVIRYTAIDPSNNTATCQFSVTITDTEPAMIFCPPSLSVGTNPSNACSYVYAGGTATATDNCSIIVPVTNDYNGMGSLTGAIFPAGVNGAPLTTTVIWSASAPGIPPTVTCTQTITVTDDDAPVFNYCPPSHTVAASAPAACNYIGVASLNATATDNCSAVTYTNSYDGTNTLFGKIFPIGSHTITWTATDAQGNSTNNCTFTLTVKDVTPPMVVGPTSQSFSFDVTAGDCAKVVTFTRPAFGAVTDCSGPVTMSEAYLSGPDPAVLTGAPAFTPGSSITVQFPAGTTVIRYTWADAAVPANTFSIDYTFVINENQAPNAQCATGPVPIIIDPQLGFAFAIPALINNGSTDNCGIAALYTDDPSTLFVDESAFNCTQLGVQPVTLWVQDFAGNVSSCNTTVFVVDNALPVIGCPSSFVVPANASCQATVPNLIFNAAISPSPQAMEYFDNSLDFCGLDFDYKVNSGPFIPLGTFFSTPVDLSAVVFNAGNNTVTVRAKDATGNLTPCTFTVSVQDQTAPVVTCPTPTVNPLLIGSCTATATWPNPTATDNCPGPISLSSTFPSGFNFPGGTTVVTYSATDVAGNVGTCTFSVVVVDNQPPVAKCKDITVNLSPTIGAGSAIVTPANIDNLSTDNCGYFYVSGNVTYTCANLGTNNYTLTIQDAAGNTASCVGVVTVQDVTAPTFTCPANVTLNANASCQAVLGGSAAASDNCSIVKYEYDLDPPAGLTFALLNNGATANLANIPALPLGVNTITLRAFDSSNNSSTCSYNVTVQDVTPPVFAGVPANVTVSCDAIPPITNPTATDNCGTATVAFQGQTFGGTSCLQTITRTWIASDNAMPANTATVSQVITVQDVLGPVFNPAFIPGGMVNINVSGPSICFGNYTLSVVNNTDIADAGLCNGVSGISYNLVPASGAPSSGVLTFAMGTYTLPVTTFPIGTNVVTLIASDNCGNTSTKVVNILVTDNQPPVFQGTYAAAPLGRCGQVYTLPNTTNNCDQLFVWTRPIVGEITDCGAFTVTESISNPTVQAFINLLSPYGGYPSPNIPVVAQFPVGETVITYTATQGSNVSTCSFTVKIVDVQPPSITCPGNQNISISSACAAAATVPTYPPATITDNCLNNVVVAQTPAPGTLISSVVSVVEAGETFTVTLKATDGQPNNLMSAPCSFTVTLIDSQSPQPLKSTLPDVVSNCTKFTVVAPGATDCNGMSVDTIWGTPSVAVMMILPPAYPGGPPSYVLNPGNYVITWAYTDPQNNTTTQPQNVFITVDVTGPVAIAQPVTVNLDAMGQATVTAAQLNNGSFDQDGCGPVTVSIRTGVSPNFLFVPSVTFDCFNIGVNQVVFAATDINGNTTTAITTVTVHDVTPPSFVNPWPAGLMDTIIQACQPIPAMDDYNQLAADVCDPAVNIAKTETSTQTNTGCGKYSYFINRTWTATDNSGNTATRTQKITVTDTQAPVFDANTPATLNVGTAPNATTCVAAVNFNMANFVSDCQAPADVTITNVKLSGPTFAIPAGANISANNYLLGTYVIRFTATDACGNSATKDLTLVIEDTTPPTAVCINGVSASLQPNGQVVVTVNQFNNNSYDNCTNALDLLIQRTDLLPLDPPSATLTFSCDDADGVTQHPVKLFVSDAAGNMSMCQTYIVIQDNVAPVITCPPSKTVQCSDNLAPSGQGTATATDNCAVLPNSITHTDAIGGGVGNICQVLTRTWSVKDQANNVATCDQILSIQDTVKPTFTILPPNITVSCSDGAIAVAPVGATDNCDANVLVVLTVDTVSLAQGPCGAFDYTIVRTWVATDDCGNTNVHTRQIKVVDIEEPAFAGMPDTIKLNTSQFPPNFTCTVPFNYNVKQFLEDCSPDTLLTVLNDAPFGDGQLDISGNYPIGDYWIYFIAVDACGNIGADSIFIQVRDNSVPTMICNNNVVIALGTNGEAMLTPGDIDLGSTDNCGIASLALSKSLFDCADLGFQTVTLTATDIYGNTNFCNVQVEVTIGNNTGFNLSASATGETYLGSANGTATAVATGGSGVFGYNWSNGATVAAIDGLPAGTYTVTATDLFSGCVSVATVTVAAGPTVTLNVGNANGCQTNTLSIPVTVDNFINVTGFSVGVALSNGTAGAITGLSNVNPALIGLVPGVNSITWTHPQLLNVTLPNGTVLFNIDVQLSNAAVGTTSNIVLAAIPPLTFIQDVVKEAPNVIFNAGSVTISCVTNDLVIAGDVFTWKAPVKPIPGVNVALAGTVSDLDVTALPNADYSFFVPNGANTVVSASKINTVKNQQINVGDMLAIQAHVAVQVPFNDGYQWVAADINGDQRVSLLDYALVQKYVLGNVPHFTDGQGQQIAPDWKFVASSHQFMMPLPVTNPNNMNPLDNPVPPQTIQRNNVTMSFLNDDFTGVLMGDVNGSVNPSFTNNNGGADNGSTLWFQLQDQALSAGEVLTVPFKASDFSHQAYQATIAFDPEVLELADIHSGALAGITESNFGTASLADGLLSTLWVGSKTTALNDGETLFALTFKVRKNAPALSKVLRSSSEIAEAMAIDQQGNTVPLDFNFKTSVSAGEVSSKVFALYQNQPNPFSTETLIAFRLPESSRATLRVFSAEGRLVKTVVGQFNEGMNTVTFRRDELGSKGVFYYELETPQYSDRKKMILLD